MSTTLFKQFAKPWRPHAYQKKAIKFSLEHACSALFLDPGLGKTSIVLSAVKFLKKQKMVEKVLIIAPLRVCQTVWPAEVEKWKDFKGLDLTVLHGKDKDKRLKEKHDIYVINPEGLEWLLDVTKVKTASGKTSVHVDLKKFKKLGFDTLVIDELSKFKHPRTNRFKALKQVLKSFQRRWGLTGTPMPNGLLDLFGQCYVLDLGNALGRYITHYRSQYFEQSAHNEFVWTPRPGADDEIYEALEPLALRMAAEDYLEMPKVIEDTLWVELSAKVYKVYDALEKDLVAMFDDKSIVAANAAVASAKCRQVVNGGVYLEPEIEDLLEGKFTGTKEVVELHKEKVTALLDLIDELQGAPLLVAYDFKHDLKRLQKALGKDVPYIGGGTTTRETQEIIGAWNEGLIPVLLAHPQSAGHGLNLQDGGCQHVAWFAMTWDYELYDQFIRRVLRQGNKHAHVFVYHIMARGTIDEVILRALKGKARGQQALFTALKDLRKKRLG